MAAEGAEKAEQPETAPRAPTPVGGQMGRLPPAPPRFANGRPAWEQAGRALPARFFGTIADACLRPVAFFTHLSREGARGVTAFAFVCLLIGNLGQAVWGLVMLPLLGALGRYAGGQLPLEQRQAAEAAAKDDAVLGALIGGIEMSEEAVRQLSQMELQLWAQLLLAPVVAYFTIHLLAGLVHFSVQPWRQPDQAPVPYEVTYRFLVYTHAPMVFAAFPTLGGIASLFSFVLATIAISKLHRVRFLGLIGGVLFPVMMLSWLWGGEVLPRIAEPLTRAVGIEARFAHELADKAPTKADVAPAAAATTENDDDDSAALEYPPMPPADRSHDVEVFTEDDSSYTERFWTSSRGTLRLRQRVLDGAAGAGHLPFALEVQNNSDHDVEQLFVEWTPPADVRFADTPFADHGGRVRVMGGVLTCVWPRIAPGDNAVVSLSVLAPDAHALLARGAAMGFEPTDEPGIEPAGD